MPKSSKCRSSVGESFPKWGVNDSTSCHPSPPPRSATLPKLSAWDSMEPSYPYGTTGRKSVVNGSNGNTSNQVSVNGRRPVSTHEDPYYYRTTRYVRSQSTGTTRTLVATTLHQQRRRFHIPCKSRSSLNADDDEVARLA